ncbi:MAG: efflux RND transporter permease subunit [Planctomycetota bacterium]
MSAPSPGSKPPSSKRHGLDTLFFRNRHLLWLAIAVILVGGLSAGMSLPRLEDPRIVNRGPLVITSMPGASAERVESQVTEVLEQALDEIAEIQDLDSTSRAGVSLISIELAPSVTARNNEQLFAEIRDKIGEASNLLPPEAADPVVDDKREAVAFTLIVGVTWDHPEPPQIGVLNRLAEDLADRLRAVPGTELVRIYGEPQEQITVEVDPAELAELGLTAERLAERIGAADSKASAGAFRGSGSDLLIEVDGELDGVRRVAQIPVVAGPQDAVLTVADLARVERGWRTPDPELALVDGRRSVLVAARVAGDVRVDGWAEQATAAVEAFEAERGPGVRFDRVFEQEPYTTDRLAELVYNLLAGAGVILLAVLLIMGLRPALIVALALPLVVSMVMFGWQLTGGAVHQMSIFGLIIALGLLIDNAIVVTDEVAAHKARGLGALASVQASVRLLFLPLLASTLTTMLAFAPIMLLPGSAGDFVGSIGVSVILAVGASFFVAITLIASLAGLFAKPALPGQRRRWWRDGLAPQRMSRAYNRVLRRLYAAPWAAVALAASLPLAGFAVAPTLGNQFFPLVDRNMFEVRVWMPTGTALAKTTEQARSIESALRTFDGVEHVSWLVGASYPSVYYNLVMNQDRSAHYAHGVVTTTSAERTIELLGVAQQRIDQTHPGAQVVVRRFGQGPPVVADIEFRVFGPSDIELQRIGDALRVALQKHPAVLHTQDTLPRGEPKLFLNADEDAAQIAGLTLGDVAGQLNAVLEGAASGSVIEDLEQLPVVVRVSDAYRADTDALASTLLVAPDGDGWTSAAALGGLELRPEIGGVNRFNSERTNTIKAYVRNGALPIDVGSQVLKDLDASGFVLPDGYRITLGGASEQEGEANANLQAHAPVLLTLMAAVLILVFRSLRYALVLAGVAVASTGLAMLSTWSIGFPISFNTILGTLGLIGVALNDSIVVLASIRADPQAASGDREAVARAVAGCTRHVIATTATTIGGFLPLLLFVGGDFWPSLAIVLVGGIAGASLVALLFIPGTHLLMTRQRRSEAAFG